MDCLVAETFATQHPQLVNKLILIGPPPAPLPAAAQEGYKKRAETVRKGGMRAVADGVVEAGTSAKSKAEKPLAVAAALQSLLSQDPEGYAKGCTALAGATQEIRVEDIKCPALIVRGNEDKVSPPAHVEKLGKRMGAKTVVLPGVGHWHGFEDVDGLAGAVGGFLKA
jgi:pimeloyl-ACP methyl ester carboxylesterase